jgi:hypothetical protein
MIGRMHDVIKVMLSQDGSILGLFEELGDRVLGSYQQRSERHRGIVCDESTYT